MEFIKMHGLGNDFVIINQAVLIDPVEIRRIGDRRTGIGFDQLIVLSNESNTGCNMRIFNCDGSEVTACGNATRCVASSLFSKYNVDHAIIRTAVAELAVTRYPSGLIGVSFPPPLFEWFAIPLSQPTMALLEDHDEYRQNLLENPIPINVGNPHLVNIVRDQCLEGDDFISKYGPLLEHHTWFPERINVEFVHILGPNRIRMRVWERGVGVTRACGTGACAAAVAAIQTGHCVRAEQVEVVLDGGSLYIQWDDNSLQMIGPATRVFTGRLA